MSEPERAPDRTMKVVAFLALLQVLLVLGLGLSSSRPPGPGAPAGVASEASSR